MLQSIFGFRGRIGRLRYFLTALALGPAFAIAFVALLVAFGLHPGDKAAALRSTILALLLVGPLWFWTGLSLQACRIRDIGWNPLFVILGWFGGNLVLRLAEFATFHTALGARHLDPLGLVISLANIAMAGVLLLWPGEGGGRSGAGDHLELERSASSATPYSPPPYEASMRPATAGFGRRGL